MEAGGVSVGSESAETFTGSGASVLEIVGTRSGSGRVSEPEELGSADEASDSSVEDF